MQRHVHGLETLEPRRHLSAVLNDHTLVIKGAAGVDDTIAVGLNTTGDRIGVTINGGAAELFDKAAVGDIVIRTFSGNDTVTIAAGVGKPSCVAAGEGNDTVTTAGARDVIYGDGGNDTINAGGGRNCVFGGRGADNILSGAGSDDICGCDGNDTVNSGAGADRVCGDCGEDKIDAGNGNDTVFGGAGDDTLSGGEGNDRLWGQVGKDNINGGAGDDILGGIVGLNTLSGGGGKDTFWVKTSLVGQTTDFDPTDVLKAQTVSAADADVELVG